jgi:GNAT superfamily N-acetyltransferase
MISSAKAGTGMRDYKEADLAECVRLVNLAWDFDSRLAGLSVFAGLAYAAGSLAQSNFAKVIDDNGALCGFLFGRCGPDPVQRNQYSGPLGGVRILTQLIAVPGVGIRKKLHLLKALVNHEAARRAVEPDRSCEVNLFVVDPASQGKGRGRALMGAFVDHCRSCGAARVTVETDVESNYGFYHHVGFKTVGEFESPLTREFWGGTGRSFVLELRL